MQDIACWCVCLLHLIFHLQSYILVTEIKWYRKVRTMKNYSLRKVSVLSNEFKLKLAWEEFCELLWFIFIKVAVLESHFWRIKIYFSTFLLKSKLHKILWKCYEVLWHCMLDSKGNTHLNLVYMTFASHGTNNYVEI